MRTTAAVIFTLALAFSNGCTPIRYGIFCNALGEPLTLTICHLTGNGGFANPKDYTLGAGKTKRADCMIAEVTAKDAAGKVLFRQVLPGAGPGFDKYAKTGEREVHYLVTRDGAFPIPIEWRKTWKEHQREIVAGFDVTAGRRLLIKEGLLKE